MPDASPAAQQSAIANLQSAIIDAAAAPFTGELNDYIENVRKAHEQLIDDVNPDKLISAAWDKSVAANAEAIINDFRAWMEAHKDEITALQIFYNQPWRRREVTYSLIKEVVEKLKADKPLLAPLHVWRAYESLDRQAYRNGKPAKNELVSSRVAHSRGNRYGCKPYAFRQNS
jgi:type I restriction enzyme R subunit